jgi:hypothetical protein
MKEACSQKGMVNPITKIVEMARAAYHPSIFTSDYVEDCYENIFLLTIVQI